MSARKPFAEDLYASAVATATGALVMPAFKAEDGWKGKGSYAVTANAWSEGYRMAAAAAAVAETAFQPFYWAARGLRRYSQRHETMLRKELGRAIDSAETGDVAGLLKSLPLTNEEAGIAYQLWARYSQRRVDSLHPKLRLPFLVEGIVGNVRGLPEAGMLPPEEEVVYRKLESYTKHLFTVAAEDPAVVKSMSLLGKAMLHHLFGIPEKNLGLARKA